MITDEMLERLDRIERQWPEVFSEGLAFGFDISWGDLDVLEQCLQERSKRALNKVLEERHSEAVIY